ncbi:MAG TPA: hypothetical protein VLA24_09430 [Pseudomonadales bacterium]|nr:hypothetical protein [Pseudomonadales bacterium]
MLEFSIFPTVKRLETQKRKTYKRKELAQGMRLDARTVDRFLTGTSNVNLRDVEKAIAFFAREGMPDVTYQSMITDAPGEG